MIPGLYNPWNSPGQNTGVGNLSLLQGIFPTQGSNPGLLHCRRILYQLRHKGSPRMLEWVAYPFSNGSSWPRNWTRASCIAGGFFTNWAVKEAPWTGEGLIREKEKPDYWMVPRQFCEVGEKIRDYLPFYHDWAFTRYPSNDNRIYFPLSFTVRNILVLSCFYLPLLPRP